MTSTLEWAGLHHHTCDEDGLFDGTVLPTPHSRFILYTSVLSLGSGAVALYKKQYTLAPVPFGVLCCSINYWRHPIHGWRRNVDMAYAGLSLCYQCVRSIGAQNAYIYFALTGSACLCYILSQLLLMHHLGLSTVFHAGIHLLGNIANICLYLGDVPPLTFVGNRK